MKDTAIIDLYFERDQTAIAETAAKYGAYLQTLAYNILHSEEDAEEAVSDTYFRVWNAIPPARPTVLRHFLSRITRNLAFDRLRKESGRLKNESASELLNEFESCIPDGRGSAEDAVEAKELGQYLNRFLSRQDETAAALFVSRYYYARPLSVIAGQYGLTERQVKYRLSRLRRELKRYLEEEGVNL